MKRNGFTLAELLGVMVILSLISIITIPAVTDSLNNYKAKLCNTQLDEIKAAAKSWATDNIGLLPTEEGAEYQVTLGDLSSSGFIDKKVNNPVTNEDFDLDTTIITITRTGKRYTYSIDEGTKRTCRK